MNRRTCGALAGLLFTGSMAGIAACSGDDTTTPGGSTPDASAADATSTTDSATSPDSARVDGNAPSDSGGSSDSGDSSVSSDSGDSSTAGDSNAPGDAGAEAATLSVALVYAGRFNNIDQRLALASLGADGRILGYYAAASEAPGVTTAVIDGVFSDTFAGVTRWTNGNIVGSFYDDGGVKAIPANDGQHLGIAKIAGDLPASGSATYTLAAFTKPTLANGASAEGTVTSGSLRAEFAGNAGTRIAYELVVQMPEGSFVLDANGGAAFVGDAGGTYAINGVNDAGFRFTNHNLAVTTDAGVCPPDAGACPKSGTTRVVFAGANAERVILSYVFGSGSLASNRAGVVVFQKQ